VWQDARNNVFVAQPPKLLLGLGNLPFYVKVVHAKMCLFKIEQCISFEQGELWIDCNLA